MGNASSFVLSKAGYGKGLCFIKHKNKLNFSILFYELAILSGQVQ